MKKIMLTTKEELNIYMSPVRQQLMHQLFLSNASMTPKMLADKLQISASSIQHHVKKLMKLGLIELDHTEIINGITASFYKPTQVTVHIGLNRSDALVEQREVLMQESIARTYDGFKKQMSKRLSIEDKDTVHKWGDILSGVVHLNKQESDGLMKLITAYIEQHAAPTVDSIPWEYAIIAYNAEELRHE